MDWLLDLFKGIWKAFSSVISFIVDNWRVLVLCVILAVLFFAPVMAPWIAANLSPTLAAYVTTSSAVFAGWSMYAQMAAVGATAILVAPEETVELIDDVGSNVAEAATEVGEAVGETIGGAIGGATNGATSAALRSASDIVSTIVTHPFTWLAAGAAALVLLANSGNKSQTSATRVVERRHVTTSNGTPETVSSETESYDESQSDGEASDDVGDWVYG